jgi:hypothetical protein
MARSQISFTGQGLQLRAIWANKSPCNFEESSYVTQVFLMNKFSFIQELHYPVWLKVASINISTVPLLHPLSDVTIFICY